MTPAKINTRNFIQEMSHLNPKNIFPKICCLNKGYSLPANGVVLVFLLLTLNISVFTPFSSVVNVEQVIISWVSFLVTFNITSYIFPNNFTEIPQVIRKI